MKKKKRSAMKSDRNVIAVLLAGLSLSGCLHSQKDGASLPADAASVIAAYIDYKFPNRPAQSRPPIFLSLGSKTDPDRGLTQSLRALGLSVERGPRYHDSKGVLVTISQITTSDGSVILEADWHSGVFSGQGGAYRFQMKDGRYVFEKADFEYVE